MPDYDLIIIGGGPAGLTAGLYAARANMHSVLLEAKDSMQRAMRARTVDAAAVTADTTS